MIFLSFVLPYTQTAPGLPSRRAFWGGGARGSWERSTPPPASSGLSSGLGLPPQETMQTQASIDPCLGLFRGPPPGLGCCLPPPNPQLLPCSGVSLGAQAAHSTGLAQGMFSNRRIIASVNCNLILAIFLREPGGLSPRKGERVQGQRLQARVSPETYHLLGVL